MPRHLRKDGPQSRRYPGQTGVDRPLSKRPVDGSRSTSPHRDPEMETEGLTMAGSEWCTNLDCPVQPRPEGPDTRRGERLHLHGLRRGVAHPDERGLRTSPVALICRDPLDRAEMRMSSRGSRHVSRYRARVGWFARVQCRISGHLWSADPPRRYADYLPESGRCQRCGTPRVSDADSTGWFRHTDPGSTPSISEP